MFEENWKGKRLERLEQLEPLELLEPGPANLALNFER
jgi:hypothetical protein